MNSISLVKFALQLRVPVPNVINMCVNFIGIIYAWIAVHIGCGQIKIRILIKKSKIKNTKNVKLQKTINSNIFPKSPTFFS